MIKNKTKLRAAFAAVLLLIILGLFAYYIHGHPAVINTLKSLNPWLVVVLVFCYGVLLVWWMGVYNATLRLCGEPLKVKENLLLTSYSTLANFFLPLQSGPGVRAAYLKRRHKVPVSGYIMATLIYFSIYAVINAAFLFVASKYWWLALPAVIVAAAISAGVLFFAHSRFTKKQGKLKLNLTKDSLMRLLLMTLGQLIIQAIIYGIELYSLHLHPGARSVISYSGAANFAIFVALTPGAIGFREAFLEFSRKLHHISTNSILSANLIDRGVFIVFLAILFIMALVTHARGRIKS